MNKKELAIILSKLKPVQQPEAKLEQYQTDSEIAAYLLWIAYLNGDINNKVIADLGCGNGILGIAALILGARKVYFADISNSSIEIARSNLEIVQSELKTKFNASFLNKPIENIAIKVDTVVENPPFGVKKKHADKVFLEKAMAIAGIIYSIHKTESHDFIYSLALDNDFAVDRIIEFNFQIKKSMSFHKKKQYDVKVACWRLKRNI